MSDLKPCPAGHTEIYSGFAGDEYTDWHVACQHVNCHWEMFGDTKEWTEEQWNARPVAEVPSLEELCNLVLDSLEQPWTMPEMVKFPHERIAGRLHALLIQRQGGR